MQPSLVISLTSSNLELLKLAGINIREIPYDVIEETTRGEVSKITNDIKKIQMIKDYRSGKYGDKTEQEFLKQDLKGGFGSLEEAEEYYADIEERENKLVDTAVKLKVKGHWQDLEELALQKKMEAKAKREANKPPKPEPTLKQGIRKRRRQSFESWVRSLTKPKKEREQKPLLNETQKRINDRIRGEQTESFEDFVNRLEKGRKKDPNRQIKELMKKL